MKFWWIILFFSFFGFSQQEIELCDQTSATYTYTTSSNEPGINEWSVDGQIFYSDDLIMTWTDTGSYVINVIRYNDGCPSEPQSLTVHITRCDDPIYWVPNTFTPDGDEYNNQFLPIITTGIDPYSYHLTIFNRWGEIIFESYDINRGWNGNFGNMVCQNGVYIWKIEFKLEKNDERVEEIGHIVILK